MIRKKHSMIVLENDDMETPVVLEDLADLVVVSEILILVILILEILCEEYLEVDSVADQEAKKSP
jgi:hypothetical protein